MTEVQIKTVESQDADIRLDRWFRTRYPGIGHGVIEKLLRTGQIRVDGRRVKASFRLEVGQKVRIPPIQSSECTKQACLLYTSPSPRDQRGSRMPSSA